MGDFERARVRESLRAQLFGKDKPPLQLGRFKVKERIGSGATSHVYAGHDPQLDRPVAIKVLRSARAEGVTDAMRARMVREGRALAKLSHPNVLRVFESGSEGDVVYLAVELVDGGDLELWLSTPRAWQQVVRIMRDVGLGVAAAHAIGLVHRDIKPANVLVDSREQVRVADFGLVQSFGASDEAASDGAGASHLTRTHGMVGSPAYMAPEQWRGDAVDSRTDIFGFGVTFFEALYGARPFGGASDAELMEAIVSGQTAPTSDDVPPWLDEIVHKAIRANAGERYPSMEELLADLEGGLTSDAHLHAGHSELAILEGGVATADFARHAAAARVALHDALISRPGNIAAEHARQKLYSLWFDHEVSQGALDSAASHLMELPPSVERRARLDRARDESQRKEDDLVRLAELDHDADANVRLRLKALIMSLQAPMWALVFIGVGEMSRRGVEIGAPQLAVGFTLYATMHVLVGLVFGDRWVPNRITRQLIEIGAMNLGGTAAMFAFAWWMDIAAATAFVFVEVMLTTFWVGAASFVDRRLMPVAAVALLAAFAMNTWPRYAVDVYGVSTGLAFAYLAWRWGDDARHVVD